MAEKHGKHSIVRPQGAAADGTDSLEAQTEELLRGIEDGSPFVLRTSSSPEDLDPSDVGESGLADGAGQLDIEEDGVGHLDDPASQIAVEMELKLAEERAQAAAEEALARSRRRLRHVLVAVLVVLALIAGVIGVFVWRNSIAPDVKQSDTEALVVAGAGSNSTVFEPVVGGIVPDFAALFGKRNAVVRERTQGKLIYEGSPVARRSDAVAKQRFVQEATLINASGGRCAQVSLGLGKKKRLVSVRCVFDLDALGVADAEFSILNSDGTVARSLLESCGVDVAGLPDGALTVQGDPSAQRPETLAGTERASFSGSTGSAAPPRSWTLEESYRHSLDKPLGDGSLIRAITVELR